MNTEKKAVTDLGKAPSVRLDKWHAAQPDVKWIVCQRHGYLCDYNGTAKGYNWTPYIKAAHVFPSSIAARKACEKIGIDADASIAEMHGI